MQNIIKQGMSRINNNRHMDARGNKTQEGSGWPATPSGQTGTKRIGQGWKGTDPDIAFV